MSMEASYFCIVTNNCSGHYDLVHLYYSCLSCRQIRIAVAADSTGHACLSTTYCHVYIDKLEIDFHGGASWLYDLFSSYISDDLKGSIETQV